METFLAACLSFGIGILLAGFVIIPHSPLWLERDRAIVYTTNNGVVCHSNSDYPQLKCGAILKLVGPKLNKLIIESK